MRTTVLLVALVALLGSPPVRTSPPRDGAVPVAEIQAHILKLENEWAQVDVTNDRSVFSKIIAPDFFSTSSRSGKRKSRAQWLADWEYEGVTSATQVDSTIRVYSANLAIFSGIDETRGLNQDGSQWVHQDICTDTWLKRAGKWQCIAAHCSRIK